MDFLIVDDYPLDTAFGGCLLYGSERGTIRENHTDGPVERRERVVSTDVHLDYIGRVCFSERAMRHIARAFGMLDDWTVADLHARAAADADELEALSAKVAEQAQLIEVLRTIDHDRPAEVYLALDGTKHASAKACKEASHRWLAREINVPDTVEVRL